MEDKTPKNLDDELDSGSTGENREESEDFGLPEASKDSDLDSGEDSEPLSGLDDSDSDLFDGNAIDDEELDESNAYKYHTNHDDDRKRNPVGLIISFVLIGIIVIAIAVYWFFFREPPQKQVVQLPVAEEVEEPAVIEEEPVQQETEPDVPAGVEETEPVEPTETFAAADEGSFEAINAPTGRYYIVLNSFVDEDLAEDYAQSMAMEGVDTKIIPPAEAKKGFNRVVLSNEYSTWQSAEASLVELKGIFGESIWVLRY